MQTKTDLAAITEKALLQTRKWNRALTRLIWLLCLILVATEGLVAWFYATGATMGAGFTTAEYMWSYFFKPAFFVVGTNTALQATARILGRRASVGIQTLVIVFTLVVLVTEACAFHYGINVIYTLYILPILASVIYVKRSILNAVYFMSVAGYLGVFYGYIQQRIPAHLWRHNYMDSLGTLVVITAAFALCHMVLGRVRDLVDITVERSIREERLSREVTLDSLTQLYNHATFYERLDELIVEYGKSKKPFSVIIMDIDNFKSINDTYGHDQGNVVLLALVEIIRGQLGPEDMAFRYGGEEFAILTPRADQAVQLAQSIRFEFSQRTYQNIPRRVTVSCGVCSYNHSFGGRREIFSAADKALYQAKHSGKNCVRLAQ